MCIVRIYMCTENVSYQSFRHFAKTLMFPMRTKVTHVHYHLQKKICQTEVFIEHSRKTTRLKAFISLL
jgi:hypothetical protein